MIVYHDLRIKVQKDSFRLEQYGGISSNFKSFFNNNPLENLKVVDLKKYTHGFICQPYNFNEVQNP